MPSNLAPEIIVTVQNPAYPDQCGDTTSGGSHESEDGNGNSILNGDSGIIGNPTNTCSNSHSTAVGKLLESNNKNGNNNLNNENNGCGKSSSAFFNSFGETSTATKKLNKNRHNNHNHHHHCKRTNIIRGDPKSSITTSIDMVEGKPRLWVSPRKSASAVRVQVTLHQPLNWQIVPTSSSAGSIPNSTSKILKHSSTSSKSTVTHSHSLSQSESLSFSISPSESIHYGSRRDDGNEEDNRQHQRHHHHYHHQRSAMNKGRVRFTELPRSRLGKHIEKIQEDAVDVYKNPLALDDRQDNTVIRSTTVSKSLCFCRCSAADVDDDLSSRKIIEEEIPHLLTGSVFPVKSSSSSALFNGNQFVLHNNTKDNEYGEKNGSTENNNILVRRKKSRSCSNAAARRRAVSYHADQYYHHPQHQLDAMRSNSSSSSDNEDSIRSSSFQRKYYQKDENDSQSYYNQHQYPIGLRGVTRRRRKTKGALSASSTSTSGVSSSINQQVKKGEEHKVNEEDEVAVVKTLPYDNNNIFDSEQANSNPLSLRIKKKETVARSSSQSSSSSSALLALEKRNEGEGRKKLANNSIPESRCQYHASFVFKRPTVTEKKGILQESSGNGRESFDSSVKKSCSCNNKSSGGGGSVGNSENKLNQQQRSRPHHYQKRKGKSEDRDNNEKSHDSAQYFHQCHFDPVMTWFKEPSGAEAHANNKGSGMGANGSSHDGRLKSRSQSSSALYCIGKSGNGNGSIIEAPGNYGGNHHHNPYLNCHSSAAHTSAGANGLSSSIPADIWDLPCTAKSYSPVSTAKKQNHRQNISHFYPENYQQQLPDSSYLNSGAAPTDVEATVPAATGHHLFPGQTKLAIGPNSSTTSANNSNAVPVGQISSSRPGKKEKGNKKGGKGNNARAKLYAVSCPDVAEHTESCGNLPVHPNQPSSQHFLHHRQSDFTGEPRFIGINEAVTEELDSSCNSIALIAPTEVGAVTMTGSSFTDIRPPYSRNPVCSGPAPTPSGEGVGRRGNLNTNNRMAQSHPHLYAGGSSVPGASPLTAITNNPIGMESYNPPGGGPSLYYSQQELPQHLQNFPQQQQQQLNNLPPHLQQQHFLRQQQQPFHYASGGVPPSVSGRSGSSRSNSHHSRSYQNLPCSSQQQPQSQYACGGGGSSINQPLCTSSSSQQQLYNHHQQQKQFVHSSSTRSSRKSINGGDLKCSQQFQMPQFIAPEYIFEVRLIRDHRGLGLSVTGGLDSQETYPGLIRVKKVFPMGPAYESGELRPYDIILEANGAALSGLTNHEALEVLRTTPTETILTICRPPINIPGFHDASLSRSVDFSIQTAHLQSQSQPALNQLSGSGSQYQSQQLVSSSHQHQHQQGLSNKPVKQTCVQCGGVQRHPPSSDKLNTSSVANSTTSLTPSVKSKSLSSLKIPPISSQLSQEIFGEFEVTLDKINGSLGFTLRQEDTSVLGHYVRALVKDPALSDGRIHPGDRIISVNGQDLSEMSHTDAINYLRSCPPQVTLRLYRDVSPTPISPLSPTESHKSLKAKPLRKEAIDMLNDLAVRKLSLSSSGGTPDPKHSLPGSVVGRTGLRGHRTLNQDVNGPATLPRRRLAHAGVTPSPEVLSAALSHFAGTAQTKSGKKSGTNLLQADQVPVTTTPPASNNSSSSGGSSGYRSSASRLTAANNSSSSNYPTETRSSGSGESTPVGTINTNKHGRKTDLYRNYSDLRSAIDLEEDEDADDGIFKGDDDDDDEDGSGSPDTLNKEETESEQTTPKARKPSFRQFTLHLDKISSLEDDDSFTSELQHHDSIVSEPGYPATDTEMGDGSNFKHGQPAYQSAIISTSTAGANNKLRGKGGKFSKDSGGFRMAGGSDSPSTLSDADIPSTLTSTTAKKMGQQSKDSKLGGKEVASTSKSNSESLKSGGLLKWKGVLFSHDDDVDEEEYDDGGESTEDLVDSGELDSSFRHTAGTTGGGAGGTMSSKGSRLSMREDDCEPEEGSSANNASSSRFLNAKHPLPPRRSPDGREFRECDTEVVNINQQCNGEQIFTVQLSRRWCSRLGFSLQGVEGGTYISAIYPDSVAAKDGRLRVGDELIMINGETVRGRSTSEVIEMMRIIRGMISITIHRRPDSEPEFDPKDHELGLT